jgi:chromosome segregation ATPase
MKPVSQSGPNVGWLDEELRKEKALVQSLRDIIDKQQVALVDQTQRILLLEDRMTKLQGQLARIPEVQESMQHTRAEIVLMLNEMRQDQQKREAEALHNRQVEREQELRAIQNIETELERLDVLEQSLAGRQAEDQRLNETVLRLQRDIEALAQAGAQGEEVRRRLADAIAKNTVEIEQQELGLAALDKGRQEAAARLLSIENTLPRYEQQLGDLQTMRQEVTAQQDQLLERERVADRVRTQTLTEWGRKIEGFGSQLEAWAEQLRFFTDQNEKGRRTLREIQELAQDVSQQQDRLRQMQRLSEEQFRREMREWRSENERRWAQETEKRDQLWKMQENRNTAYDDRLQALEDSRDELLEAIRRLGEQLDLLRADVFKDAEIMKRAQRQAWQGIASSLQEVATEMRATFEEEAKA